MSTWGIAGSNPFQDLPKDVEALVIDLINSSLWTETDPPRNDIEFGTGWGRGIELRHAIHGRHLLTAESGEKTVDWRKTGFNTDVEIHVFAKRNDNNEPAQLGNMIREIRRILGQNRTSVGYGLRAVTMPRFLGADDPASFGSQQFWHRIGICTVRYMYADIS